MLPKVTSLFVVSLLCLLTGAVAVPSAHADEVSVSTQITGVTITGSDPGSEIVLSGVVANTGSTPAYGVQVIFWRSTEKLRDVAMLMSLSSGRDVPEGERLVEKEENFFVVGEAGKPFPAKSKTAFTVRAKLADLRFPAPGAPYAVGVDVRANADGSSRFQTVGRVRVPVPIPTRGTAATTAPLILLSSEPSLVAPAVFTNDHLAKELDTGGRLDMLLRLAETTPASYVIDPALLDEVQQMTQDYSVLADDDKPREGTSQDVAKAWMERFEALPSENGYRTLFALPDVATAAKLGDDAVLTHALKAGEEAHKDISSLPLIVIPPSGNANAATVAYLKDSGAEAIATSLLRNNTTWAPGNIPLMRLSAPAAPTGVDRAPGIGLVMSSEAMLLQGTRRAQVRLVSTEADIKALAASPPWLAIRPLPSVPTPGPGTTRASFGTQPVPPGLAEQDFAQLKRWANDYSTFAELAPTAPTAPLKDKSLSRGASSHWVNREGPRSVWFSKASAEMKEAIRGDKVFLTASSTFVMSGKVNEFPITITNNLPYRVKVQVKLISSNPQRVQVSDPEAVTVNRGESRTVNIRPEATANGVVDIVAVLATTSGAFIGTSIEATVEATQYGMWGWVLVVVSGLVLVGTTAWSLKKSKGRTRAEEAV